MSSGRELLGILRPTGGGDPVPLKKEELTIGRRPKCDIQLDFENVSGKHCVLRWDRGVWHVRDLGSTNGTTLNGHKVTSEQAVLPTDELVVATHPFRIDYEPSGPIPDAGSASEGQDGGAQKHPSLLEMAGIETGDRPRPQAPPEPRPEPRLKAQPTAPIARPSAEEATFDDVLPADFQAAPPPAAALADDDDFFKLIEDDVK
jgi:hypothetical protein